MAKCLAVTLQCLRVGGKPKQRFNNKAIIHRIIDNHNALLLRLSAYGHSDCYSRVYSPQRQKETHSVQLIQTVADILHARRRQQILIGLLYIGAYKRNNYFFRCTTQP